MNFDAHGLYFLEGYHLQKVQKVMLRLRQESQLRPEEYRDLGQVLYSVLEEASLFNKE